MQGCERMGVNVMVHANWYEVCQLSWAVTLLASHL
jgi:hypothetical protein